jgi:hypothetical protein
MKEILLSRGKVTLVDDKDYEWLNRWKWYCHKRRKPDEFYAARQEKINDKKQTILMHRVILGLTDRLIQGDHRNGDGLNNQRYNLRKCNNRQNAGNSKVDVRKKANSTSCYKGVFLNKTRPSPWIAQISIYGKSTHLGAFKVEIDAAKAYNEAAIKHFGEFAQVNII